MLRKHGAGFGVALVGAVALSQWCLTGVIFVPFNTYLLAGMGFLAVGMLQRFRFFLVCAEVLAWMSLLGTCCMPPSLIERFYGDITERTASWWMISNYFTLLMLILLVRFARSSAPRQAEKAAEMKGEES